MNARLAVAAAAVVVSLTACGSQEDAADSDGPWVGTITTEDNVTTVVNESGSVWGGTARLVEEVSIGVAAGTEEYMLGNPWRVWDTGERILLTDWSPPTVRVYDGAGNYLGSVGRSGQGPGEYQAPFSVASLPDGRILITDSPPPREWVDVFSPDLVYLERWGPFISQLTAMPGARLQPGLIVGTDGEPYMRYREIDPESRASEERLRYGWRRVGPDGLGPPIWVASPNFEPWRSCEGCSGAYGVHFAPFGTASFLPTTDTVTGINDEYRFEIRRRDGSTVVVYRYWDPVPVSDEEWEYWMRWERATALSRNPGWRRTGPDVPRHKPAFDVPYAARDGRILMERLGPSRRVAPCTEQPRPDDEDRVSCWQNTYIWDVFANDGRYLGEIEPPPDRRFPPLPPPFLEGERLTVASEDSSGTIRIKRYRLVLPGEE